MDHQSQQQQQQQQQPDLTSKIRLGLQASQQAKVNITAAEEACDVWKEIFDQIIVVAQKRKRQHPPIIISPQVMKLSNTLYASCLVRVGRDSDAILIYDYCLETFVDGSSVEELCQWKLGKAQCLQRLLNYSSAMAAYQTILDENDEASVAYTDRALMGATTCALRIGNVSLAQDIILSHNLDGKLSGTADLLATCLEYLNTGDVEETASRLKDRLAKKLVEESSSKSSTFLYQWIFSSMMTHCKPHQNYLSELQSTKATRADELKSPEEFFLDLIRVNTSPLDDPDLLYLDDKIELHKMLSPCRAERDHNITSSFWPEGFVLPKEIESVGDKLNQEQSLTVKSGIQPLWISKSRAGYGSHGNQILILSEAYNNYAKWIQDDNSCMPTGEDILLQKMIDPLLLLNGYKFSLRIYVVYFSSTEAYISSKGLVKVASEPLAVGDQARSSNESRDPRQHMTNSGRETSIQQYDLDYLWNTMGAGSNCNKKDELWNDITNTARHVLTKCYPEYTTRHKPDLNKSEQTQQWKKRREEWGIPKILGLDFVVSDGNVKPWLVEINRFPGLEPRDETDRIIKYQVVKDAWRLASGRLRLEQDINPVEVMLQSFPSKTSGTSLQRL
jgi:hypothetical protein